MSISRLLILILPVIALVSCKPKSAESTEAKAQESSYFSIKAFAADQWRNYHDQPYGIIKIVSLNGKTDTLYTNANKVNWGDILKLFLETDISNKKFLDQYTFTSFTDEVSMSEHFSYEAKDKKLFTQKLDITSNISNHRITSVYVETAKNSQWGMHTQKLLYVPVKSILIQEFQSAMIGENKELKVEYLFM